MLMPGNSNSGGRNRLSVREHRLRGTFTRSRHGRWGEAPTAAPLSLEPPAFLSEDARLCWREFVEPRRAVLTQWDELRLEQIAVHTAIVRRIVRRPDELQQQPGTDLSRLLRTLRSETEIVRSLTCGFGCSPLERCRLELPQPPTTDEFSQFDSPSRWEGALR